MRKEPSQDKEANVRTFICIDIPAEIKLRMEKLQATLRSAGGQVSWTRPNNIHLTLKFLGNVPAARVAAVCSGVRTACQGIGSFKVTVSGAGCFPSPRSPRVLWVGLAKAPELVSLYESVEDAMSSLGFDRETRTFSPHLTIGRLRSRENAQRLGELITSIGFESETFEAREVIVMRSSLKPTGAIYTPLDVIPLGTHL